MLTCTVNLTMTIEDSPITVRIGWSGPQLEGTHSSAAMPTESMSSSYISTFEINNPQQTYSPEFYYCTVTVISSSDFLLNSNSISSQSLQLTISMSLLFISYTGTLSDSIIALVHASTLVTCT